MSIPTSRRWIAIPIMGLAALVNVALKTNTYDAWSPDVVGSTVIGLTVFGIALLFGAGQLFPLIVRRWGGTILTGALWTALLYALAGMAFGAETSGSWLLLNITVLAVVMSGITAWYWKPRRPVS